jgi:hypothetical protein
MLCRHRNVGGPTGPQVGRGANLCFNLAKIIRRCGRQRMIAGLRKIRWKPLIDWRLRKSLPNPAYWSQNDRMERKGVEPSTSAVRLQRSPN